MKMFYVGMSEHFFVLMNDGSDCKEKKKLLQ